MLAGSKSEDALWSRGVASAVKRKRSQRVSIVCKLHSTCGDSKSRVAGDVSSQVNEVAVGHVIGRERMSIQIKGQSARSSGAGLG